MHFASAHPHVVIASGGVAAVECALALHDLAGDRIRMTIVAPNRELLSDAAQTPQSAGATSYTQSRPDSACIGAPPSTTRRRSAARRAYLHV